MGNIKENLDLVKNQIAKACINAKRDPFDVSLIAVTKLHDPSEINEAIKCGATDIGENKVQEIMAKYEYVEGTVNWHLIGHLQTNKVKYIADKVKMIHSVDSLRLAEEIEKRVSALGRTMDILIQVNAAGEEQKSGVAIKDTEQLLKDILNTCPHIYVKGLMQVAPAAENPEDVRIYFKEVKNLYDKLAKEVSHPNMDFRFLSMGMSSDYQVAIEEGSNMVRIGTAIFGARDYSKDKKAEV